VHVDGNVSLNYPKISYSFDDFVHIKCSLVYSVHRTINV